MPSTMTPLTTLTMPRIIFATEKASTLVGVASKRGNDGRHRNNINIYACSMLLMFAVFIGTSFAIMEELSPGK